MGADGFDFFVHGGIGLGAGGGRGRGLGRRGRHGESRVGLMSTVKGTGLRLATRRIDNKAEVEKLLEGLGGTIVRELSPKLPTEPVPGFPTKIQ